MSRKKRSLSIPPMSAHYPDAITFVFAFSPLMPEEETHPCECSAQGGVLTVQAPVLCPAIGRHAKRHQFKTRCGARSSLYAAQLFKKRHKQKSKRARARVCVCQSARDNQHQSQMPAYATNMRLKFPVLALTLEIITIILFAVFVEYDDGKHSGDSHSSNHTQEQGPMDLYPSKST